MPDLKIQQYYDALNRHDLPLLERLVADDLVHHGIPGSTRDAFKRTLTEYRKRLSRPPPHVDDMLSDGDRVAVRTTTSGTHLGMFLNHPPSGRRFAASALGFYRIEAECHQRNLGGLRHDRNVAPARALHAALRMPAPAIGNEWIAASVVRSEAPATPPKAGRPPGPALTFSLREIRADPLGFLVSCIASLAIMFATSATDGETILLNRPSAIRHVLHEREPIYSKLEHARSALAQAYARRRPADHRRACLETGSSVAPAGARAA